MDFKTKFKNTVNEIELRRNAEVLIQRLNTGDKKTRNLEPKIPVKVAILTVKSSIPREHFLKRNILKEITDLIEKTKNS